MSPPSSRPRVKRSDDWPRNPVRRFRWCPSMCPTAQRSRSTCVGFHDAFAGDIDDETAAELAVVQRPANVKAVSEAVTNEAFRSVPSWVLITRQDRAISHDLQRFMVGRTDAQITELDAAHAVMISHPEAVADLITQAASSRISSHA